MNEQLKIIISAEIDKLKSAMNKGKEEVRSFSDKAKEAFKGFNEEAEKMGEASKTVLATIGASVAGAATALLALSSSTEEYRTAQAKLNTAFEDAGMTAQQATETYNGLYRVLGDGDVAVEAANHLAKLTNDQKALSEYTNICQGVYATFGDSLPIEGLTEAINHTSKLGETQGVLADALEWSGVSTEAFNEKLAACNTEAEREKLIRDTLNGLYSDAAAKYEKNNAEVIKQNEAQAKLDANLAKVGKALAPVNTALTKMAGEILNKLTPYVNTFATQHMPKLESITNKVADAVGKVIKWIADNWNFLTNLATVIITIAAAWTTYSTAMKVVNAVMALNKFNLVALAISALIAVIVLCVKNWDTIKATAVKAWDSIKSAWSGAVSWFGNLVDGIKQKFKDIGKAVGDAITGTVKKAINGVLSTASRIINGFIDAINSAIGFINKIPGVNISRLSRMSVPQMAKGGIVDSATLAVVGESGKEAVVPLENNLEWLDKLAGMLNDRMGGNQPIVLQVDGKTFAQVSCDSINALTRHRGSIPLVLA